jgi:hypothetical protein
LSTHEEAAEAAGELGKGLVIAALTFATGLPTALAWGFATREVWRLLIAPAFGLPLLTIWTAMGIRLLALSFLVHVRREDRPRDDWSDPFRSATRSILGALIFWTMGALYAWMGGLL